MAGMMGAVGMTVAVATVAVVTVAVVTVAVVTVEVVAVVSSLFALKARRPRHAFALSTHPFPTPGHVFVMLGRWWQRR